MAQTSNGLITDTILSLEGGVDSGFASPLILPNQTAWAVNTTHRYGWPEARPGWKKLQLSFEANPSIGGVATQGKFQGAGAYITDNGEAYIAYSMSGRIFTINLTAKNRVSEISIPGDFNMANRPHAWFQQAENWLIVQNGLNPPFLYNGATARRAVNHEVPIGGPMAYGKGRLWVARDGQFYGGDLVGSHPDLGRDSVIKFEENTFLNEGGAFSVESGPITGLAFAANLDSALGVGALLISTADNVFAFDAPVDRDLWKDLQYPIMTYAAREFGALNHESMVVMNGDVIYRSTDGIRSLMFARRDFQEWGNSPISRQIERSLRYDTEQRLYAASAANFDNRMMMTIQPQLDPVHGIYHRGLVVLDYHLVTGMGRKTAPAWEGVWTGLKVLQVLTVRQGKDRRCFILALGCYKELELWEVTKSRPFDFNGSDDVPIQWTVESRGMTFGLPTTRKRLQSANQWLDKILGDVTSRVLYRTDDTPCWNPWSTWSDCVQYRNCGESATCPSDSSLQYQPATNFRSQQRPRIGLVQPVDVPDQQTGGFTRDGFFFQMRFENTGRFRLKILEALASDVGDTPYGDMRNTSCDPGSAGSCATEACQGIECCDRDDYGYTITTVCGADGEYPYPYSPDDPPPPPPDPPPPDDNPIYDPNNPGGEPTPSTPCGVGSSAAVIASQYGWSLYPDQNPNQLLTPDQIAHAKALLNSELNAYGYVAVSNYRWVSYPTGGTGQFLSALLKPTDDAFDGIGDTYINGSVATYLAVAICVT